MTAEKWLTTTEAAELLGVHPATIRRWADDGDLPMMTTPGGHRRFALSDLNTMAQATTGFDLVSFENQWAEHALTHARDQIRDSHDGELMGSFEDDHRDHGRELGRRLLGLILRYVSMQRGGDELLEEVRQIGFAYAQTARAAEMPLNQALKVAMFFRDGMIQSTLEVPQSASLGSSPQRQLLNRLNPVLNTLQLAIVDAYQDN